MFLKKIKSFPFLLTFLIALAGFIYFFSFLFPFTNNAFVVANITPIAADVSGFITDIYVKNGQAVKKGQDILKVFQDPYELAYDKAQADYHEGLQKVEVLLKQTQKNKALLESQEALLQQAKYDYGLKSNKKVSLAVAKIDVQNLDYTIKNLTHQAEALRKQLDVDDQQVKQQKQAVLSLEAAMKNAQLNLDLTTVKAFSDGIIDNLYLAVGTPIIEHQPLFSFVDMSNIYIQANFNEIDLRHVRAGAKATIIPRMYFGSKIYHGVVEGNTWAVNRQITTAKNQIQTVTENENNWVLLPQRLPVQIRITDYDHEHYPLSVGSSAYVYISNH
jgi:multidrug efflux system membrane fusion protein